MSLGWALSATPVVSVHLRKGEGVKEREGGNSLHLFLSWHEFPLYHNSLIVTLPSVVLKQ